MHPTLNGHLTTSGVGHLMFWKLADTFTGLKLQKETGKFGMSELSDVATFIFLGDGRVLSGSDSGHLLLWEGGAVKCEIGPCHQGVVNSIIAYGEHILTAGNDGFVRQWRLSDIVNADLPVDKPDSRVFGIHYHKELNVSDGASVSLK